MRDEVRDGDVVRGRYQVVRQIGSGAGGKIHLGLDLRLGNRATAIKFYEPDALIHDLSEHVRSGSSRAMYTRMKSRISTTGFGRKLWNQSPRSPQHRQGLRLRRQGIPVSGPAGVGQTRPFRAWKILRKTLEAAFAQGNARSTRG